MIGIRTNLLRWRALQWVGALMIVGAVCFAAAPKPKLVPQFGADVVELDAKRAARVGLPARYGLTIQSVTSGECAARVGLRAGDVLLRIDDQQLSKPDDLTKWIAAAVPKKDYDFTIYRIGRDKKWFKTTFSGPMQFYEDRSEEWSQWEAAQAKLPDDSRPFEVKGDYLGMKLEHFTAKYRRATYNGFRGPDMSGGGDEPGLLFRGEYSKAGIVHAARLPRSELDRIPGSQTIAGVPAKFFIYQFVDGELYQVTVIFSHDTYARVVESLKAKFELPAEAQEREYHWLFGFKLQGEALMWRNDVSELCIFEEVGGLEEFSALFYRHKLLAAKAFEAIRSKVTVRTDDL